MVHFTQCYSAVLFYSDTAVYASRHTGYPIRKSTDQWICAPTRGLSQLITSFFAFQLQGIHHKPIFRLTILLFRLTFSPPCWNLFLSQAPDSFRLACKTLPSLFPSLVISKNSFIWRLGDLNPWPSACKADALANWAKSPLSFFKVEKEIKTCQLCYFLLYTKHIENFRFLIPFS